MDGENIKNVWILQAMLKNKKVEWIKKLLALISLAHIASRESVKILENYYKNPDPKMGFYARMALEEAKFLAKST